MAKNFSFVIGSFGDDILYTSQYRTSVWGLLGDDTIEDMSKTGEIDSGRDFLYGNYGDDIIITHAGRDVLGGGDGDDHLISDNASNIKISGGSGYDVVTLIVDDPSLYADHDLTGDEIIDLGGHVAKLHKVERVEFVGSDWSL